MLTQTDLPDFEKEQPFLCQEDYMNCLLNAFAVFLLDYQKEYVEITGSISELIPMGYAALAELKLRGRTAVRQPSASDGDSITPALFFKTIKKRLLHSPHMPLRQICDRLYLDDFGVFCLTGAIAFSLDTIYSRILASPEGFPVDLLARIFYGEAFLSHRQFPHIQHTLDALSLLLFFPESDRGISMALKADSRLMTFLYHPDGENMLLKPYCFYTSPEDQLPPVIANREILNGLKHAVRQEQKQFLLWGEEGSGKRYFVKLLCAEFHYSCLFVDSDHFFSLEGQVYESSVWELVRECFFKELSCCFYDFSMEQTHSFARCTAAFSQLLPYTPLFAVTARIADFTMDKTTSSVHGLHMMVQDIPVPNASIRGDLLKHYLRRDQLEKDLPLQELANKFAFTPGQILAAVSSARKEQRRFSQTSSMNTACLLKGFHHTLEHSLSQKATRIPACFVMDDVVLPKEQKNLLQTACSYVRHSDTIYNDWNFSSKIVYGKGTSLLFYGPPGTGKTMTAQVLANELGLELYRIDLSRIADKYVGETEKNLAFIFEQAKKASAILFFDEADALFGKRSEVSSSNDKYSNMETSFLLQCIEDYDGISILATNNKQNIDPAFYRRIRFFVNFPMPDASMRLEIWKKSFPDACPLEPDIPFAELAQTFELSGAGIKNIALNAAFYAAARDTPITLACIVNSICLEYRKTNPVSGPDCVNPYTHLLW